MSSNARLVVEVAASLGSFREDMGKAAATADANAKKIQSSFAAVDSQLSKFSKTAVGLIGVPLGIGAIIGTLKHLEEAAIASERSVAQLRTVLETTGHAAGLTEKDLEQFASSIKESSIFSASDIHEAETALLRFRDIQGDVFRQALKLGPDVATVLGVKLPEAIVFLGKFLTADGVGGMKALKAAGASLSEQNIDLSERLKETGDVAGSMAIKLNEVAKSVGGAARTNTQGLGGDVNQLSRAYGGLEKAFAKAIFGNQSFIARELTVSFQGLAFAITNLGEAGKVLGTKFWDTIVPGGAVIRRMAEAAKSYVFGQPQGTRERSGKIDTTAADRAEADEGAAAQLASQQATASYHAEQTALRQRAAYAAAFYGSQLAAQRAYLDKQEAADEFAYSRGEITIEEFYSRKTKAVEDFMLTSVEANEAEITAQRNLANAGSTSLEARLAAEQRIDSLREHSLQTRIGLESKYRDIERKQIVEVERLGDEYGHLAEQILLAAGNSGAAAAISFERTNRQFRNQLVSRGDTEGLGALGNLAARDVRLADLGDETRKYQNSVEELGIAQSRVDAQAASGALSEIELLNRKAEIAKQFIPILNAQIEAQERLAAALPLGPDRDSALLRLAQERAQVEQLGIAANGLKNRFDNIFSDNFATALDDIVSRAKSVSQAFKDMGRSIASEITHLVNQQIAKKLFAALFGEGGPTGGQSPGGWLAALFGALGSGGGGGGIGYGTAGSLIPAGPFPYANGTDFARGGWSVVGERGIELVNMRPGAQVIPNHEVRKSAFGGSTTVVNVNVLPGASRQTADQAAAAQVRALRRASRVT